MVVDTAPSLPFCFKLLNMHVVSNFSGISINVAEMNILIHKSLGILFPYNTFLEVEFLETFG